MPTETPLVLDMGTPLLHVRDIEESVKFYRDLLGFQVVDDAHRACCHRVKISAGSGTLVLFESTDFTPIGLGAGGLGSPYHLQVEDFPKAAALLEQKGVTVNYDDPHGGTIIDPSGNAIGMRDHVPPTPNSRRHRRDHR